MRPCKERLVEHIPAATYYKPRGIPLLELECVQLAVDQLEALRLVDAEGLSHGQAAARMGVSASTLCRILGEGRRTVALALTRGQAISIEGGNWQLREAPACTHGQGHPNCLHEKEENEDASHDHSQGCRADAAGWQGPSGGHPRAR